MKKTNTLIVFTLLLGVLSAQAENNQEVVQDMEKSPTNLTHDDQPCGQWYDGRCLTN